jgi:hypothetical protein
VKRERPVAVGTLAIVSLLLGGLGLATGLAVQTFCLWLGGPDAPCAVVPPAPATAAQCRANVFGFAQVEILIRGLVVILPVLVLVAGLGLRAMRPWAPTLALAVGALTLVVLVTIALYEFTVILPAIEDWRDVAARRTDRSEQMASVAAEVQWVSLSLLIGGLVFFVHALATLVVLRSPAVVDAFRRPRSLTREQEAACPQNYSTATS